MTKSLDSVILRYVGYALVFLTAVYLLYLVRGALPVFAVGGLLAYALEPVLRRLERSGRSRRGAVGFVFFIFVLLFLLGLALLASAWQQAQSLASNSGYYQNQVQTVVDNGRERIEKSKLPPDMKKSITEGITQFQSRAIQAAPARLQDAVTWMLGSIGTLAIFVVVLPIVTLWLMLEANPLRARMLMLVPPIYRRDVTEISAAINEIVGHYVRGQLIVCSLFGIFCTVSFYTLHLVYGMGYPLILGLLAGLVYIVPYLGMTTIALAAGLTGYFTATAGHQTSCAIAAVLSVVAFNLVIDYGISPRVLGQGVGLHPLMVIFALLSGAQLGGPLGMILAVPFFASLRVVAIYLFPQLAAPIPSTPPEANELNKGRAADQLIQQTREAEDNAPTSPVAAAVASAPTIPTPAVKVQP